MLIVSYRLTKISSVFNLLCVLTSAWEDLNTQKVQKTQFIRTKHNMQILGVIPFIKLKNDT